MHNYCWDKSITFLFVYVANQWMLLKEGFVYYIYSFRQLYFHSTNWANCPKCFHTAVPNNSTLDMTLALKALSIKVTVSISAHCNSKPFSMAYIIFFLKGHPEWSLCFVMRFLAPWKGENRTRSSACWRTRSTEEQLSGVLGIYKRCQSSKSFKVLQSITPSGIPNSLL